MTEDPAVLDAAVAEARRAWPALALPPHIFREDLAARLDGTTIERLSLGDLFLACACAHGVPGAAEALEAHAFAPLDPMLARLGARGALADEVKQRLRARLLVAPPGERPRITGYGGRGELRRWLKVAATREALELLGRARQARHLEDEDARLEDALAPGDGPELALLKRTYRAEFKEAFQGALAALEPRSRTILRYYLVDGLNIDRIGAIYGVHRATAARWIERLREDLLLGTRERLMAKVEVGRGELDSIMRLIQSQLDVSIQRFLADPDAPAPKAHGR